MSEKLGEIIIDFHEDEDKEFEKYDQKKESHELGILCVGYPTIPVYDQCDRYYNDHKCLNEKSNVNSFHVLQELLSSLLLSTSEFLLRWRLFRFVRPQ